MIKEAKKYLTDLGLKENEAEVYLTCLQKPMGMFVHEIARDTKLKRSTIDLILQRLSQKQFISKHKQGARWVYCAESPERISLSINEQIKGFDSFIPTLLNSIEHGQMPSVRFYEGEQGVEIIYDDILLTCKRLDSDENELLIISSGRDLIKLLPHHQKRFIRKRIHHGIPVRMLAPQTPLSEKLYPHNPKSIRQAKFFDEKSFPFKIEVNIYHDKIAFLNFSDPGIMGTIIESKHIALSMKSIFNMLWLSS